MTRLYETTSKLGHLVVTDHYTTAHWHATRSKSRIKVLDTAVSPVNADGELAVIEVIDPKADRRSLSRKAPTKRNKRDKRRGEVCPTCWMEHAVADSDCDR